MKIREKAIIKERLGRVQNAMRDLENVLEETLEEGSLEDATGAVDRARKSQANRELRLRVGEGVIN